ncbi:MAG: hypothetical protein BGO40_01400 [Chryseobacterium sp. 39-10]|nr:hypothetical protein [Chryseobacterium sp.]OJV48478.1 MAG: hypothetical protein BGO40_01400 [Chryseobacterium sp. 39-10]
MLTNKKILFISAHFFGYEKAIIDKMKTLGAEVDFYNERPSDSVLSKGIIRVNRALYQKRINRYYRQILAQTEGRDYDFFLLIKGESIPHFFLEALKVQHPAICTVFYSYDAVAEYPKFKQLYPYFDKNFTFEPADAKNYQLHFRPLFFLDEYSGIPKKKHLQYDLVFIGSAHTDRYLIGEKVRHLADNLKLNTFFYYYAPGRIAFLLKKLFDKNLQQFNLKKLSFKKLNHSEIAAIYDDSFSVLDINKPFQHGLTMRTFEALASGKKLLTTNTDVQNYPFFCAQNIQMLYRGNITLDADFFSTPFRKLDDSVLEKMSLESWLHCLFVQHQDDYWSGFRQQ